MKSEYRMTNASNLWEKKCVLSSLIMHLCGMVLQQCGGRGWCLLCNGNEAEGWSQMNDGGRWINQSNENGGGYGRTGSIRKTFPSHYLYLMIISMKSFRYDFLLTCIATWIHSSFDWNQFHYSSHCLNTQWNRLASNTTKLASVLQSHLHSEFSTWTTRTKQRLHS